MIRLFFLSFSIIALLVCCNPTTQTATEHNSSSISLDTLFTRDGISYELCVYFSEKYPASVDVALSKEHLLLVQEQFFAKDIGGEGAIMQRPIYSLSSDSLFVLIKAKGNGGVCFSRQSWSLCRYSDSMRSNFMNAIKDMSNSQSIDTSFVYSKDSFYVTSCLVPYGSVTIPAKYYTSDLVSSDITISNRDLFLSLYKNGVLLDSISLNKKMLDLPIADEFDFHDIIHDIVIIDSSISIKDSICNLFVHIGIPMTNIVASVNAYSRVLTE